MQAYLQTLWTEAIPSEEHLEKLTGPFPGGATSRSIRAKGEIAVLPLFGPLTRRASMLTALFGGTSLEKWLAAFDKLVADSAVGAVVLDVDSPGGTVDGVPEAAEHIYKARGPKPIVAVANAWAASAAYWVASAADELIVTPSGEVGSIGVWLMHVDSSKHLEMLGEKVTVIAAGEHKAEWNPYEPLSEEAKEEGQRGVDHYYSMFASAVAKHRGVTPAKVRNGFGKGRMVRAQDALGEGMVDRIATLDQTVKRLGGNLAERRAIALEIAKRQAEVTGLEAELGIDGTVDANAQEDPKPEAPYPNEHACRLVDPDKFRKGKNDWGVQYRKHDGKEYRVIRGKLKKDGKWADQAFRYKKDVWGASEAQKHCREHDGRFEAAKGEE